MFAWRGGVMESKMEESMSNFGLFDVLEQDLMEEKNKYEEGKVEIKEFEGYIASIEQFLSMLIQSYKDT